MAPHVDSGSDRWWRDRLFRAVTLYPWATMDVDAELGRLEERGVNTVFVVAKESDGRVFYDSSVAPSQVPNRDLLSELVDAAADRDLALVPSLFALCDEYLVERHPEAVQVARDGTEIRYPNVSMEWMHWVCPNHDPVRDHLRTVVEEIAAYDVDGVQFTHFEFQPVRNRETNYRSCVCEECAATYDVGAQDGSTAWEAARSDAIVDLLADVARPLRDRDEAMVNIELEMFADLESGQADSREILGVDQAVLAEYADVLTPRATHVTLDVHPLWIRDVVRSLRSRTGAPIVPSVRTAAETAEDAIPNDELHTAIQMALHGGSQGVSLFSTGANIGRITPDQWETVHRSFRELAEFERTYWGA